VQEVVQRFTKCSEVTDVQPRYPYDIGRISGVMAKALPIVSIEPDDYPGATGWLYEGSDDAHVEWRVKERPEGKEAMVRVTDPGSDLDVILAFDMSDLHHRDTVYAAARTGWLAVCSRDAFEHLTGSHDVQGVSYVRVRREDLHGLLAP
jgi:hypothetical protein